MPTRRRQSVRVLLLVVAGLGTFGLGGCVLAPRETADEKARLEAEGKARQYNTPVERRTLAELPPAPNWHDVLRRSLEANGDLEAAYFQWAAAVHRVQQAGGYPNTPLSLGFEQMFGGGGRGFENSSISVGPDPMENLAFPAKVYQAAKVALDDARAARKRFVAAKFDLQRKVLNGWYDYALLAERGRVLQANLSLLRLINDTAAGRVRAGGQQQDLQRAEIELRRLENEMRDIESELPRSRAMLNAMMAREPDAPLEPPSQIPAARPVPTDDAKLLALAAEHNPELQALAHRTAGRQDALELARLQYIPDFNPFTGFTGTASQVVGIGISIPTFLPRVDGMVKEARANLREAEAMRRQAGYDRAAQVVAALYAVRNSERQADLFDRQIVPAAGRVVDSARQAYAAGTASFIDLIDAQRTLLDVRLTAAEARTARQKSLADLEALIGLDIETLIPAVMPPATGPATNPAPPNTQDVP